MAMKVILASKSSRRSDILNNIGLKFDVVKSGCDESYDVSMKPEDVVKYLSYKKAYNVAKNLGYDALVIGADTIVVLDDMIMGKPKSTKDAFDMLKKLSGRCHTVYTGICVIKTQSLEKLVDFESTIVKIKDLSDEEIENYIESGEPMDKAGGYAIQGLGSLIVERLNGCYFNVVGLPVYKLSCMLKKFGLDLLSGNNIVS
jgi:septum formation protein